MTDASPESAPTPTPPGESPTRVTELCVNLDDVSPQRIADAMQRLFEHGALDVWTTPIGMKKNRPGILLSVLCQADQQDTFARLILEHTGSFGVRYRSWDRLVLDRDWITAQTPFGPVRLKVGRLEGKLLTVAPEHEDVARLAREHSLPYASIEQAAQAAAQTYREQHA